ncbi:hypothetical protein [Desulfobacter vibrioformis]|nr:hypothetical protein [Desulfobacter vibrioformis]
MFTQPHHFASVELGRQIYEGAVQDTLEAYQAFIGSWLADVDRRTIRY